MEALLPAPSTDGRADKRMMMRGRRAVADSRASSDGKTNQRTVMKKGRSKTSR
jgi:hypothetical protein